ncbi:MULTISPECIES: hypothetical protein [Metallosphaera]|uniref:hypothetical protein n=1 Tax=Metallosphaera TaxID=41980 RepID=UPI001F067510|nr:hypothetical protein [Metallosphaera sedula]MCH1770241.1 hypothetical protein [Metallosphaera sedula]MCP6727925.1 hypothetical protein [Metallosphaera sedula]BBL47490.1 oligopeptide dipeptide ABC transporter ATPase subunit [Metallosphaera sedula]
MIVLKDGPIPMIKDITCILGEWDDYKKRFSEALKRGDIEAQYIDPFTGEYMSKKDGLRSTYLIPSHLERGRVRVKDLLSAWLKTSKRAQEIMFLLGIPDDFLDNLSDLNLVKVYLAPLFMEKTRFVIVEDFFQEVEEQGRLKVERLLAKIIRSRRLDSLFFVSSVDLISPCTSVTVMYEDEVVETGARLIHPYSMVLANSAIRLGKRGEKVGVSEVGRGSLSGCRFHDYCEVMRRKKELQRLCRLQRPPIVQVEDAQVKCWDYVKRN